MPFYLGVAGLGVSFPSYVEDRPPLFRATICAAGSGGPLSANHRDESLNRGSAADLSQLSLVKKLKSEHIDDANRRAKAAPQPSQPIERAETLAHSCAVTGGF